MVSERPKGSQITFESMFENLISSGSENRAGKIPVSVKPKWHLKGEPATHGLSGAAENQTETTAFVEKMQGSNELYLFGTNTQHALGAGASGINPKAPLLINPYRGRDDASRIPGGSTSGGSVAVCTGLVSLAIGSDGGGSTRIPAAIARYRRGKVWQCSRSRWS